MKDKVYSRFDCKEDEETRDQCCLYEFILTGGLNKAESEEKII
jgi:hypothetical protein